MSQIFNFFVVIVFLVVHFQVINAELFKCLQQTYGECYQDFMLNKLVPVVGNISESNLGLEGDLATVIANEVDVIINSAASITFHERL